MISVKPRMVQGLALALVAVAVPFALWLSRPPVNERSLGRPRRGGLPISHVPDASAEQVRVRIVARVAEELVALGQRDHGCGRRATPPGATR